MLLRLQLLGAAFVLLEVCPELCLVRALLLLPQEQGPNIASPSGLIRTIKPEQFGTGTHGLNGLVRADGGGAL